MLALPMLAYAALCGLMYAQQRALIYFPQGTRTDAVDADFILGRDGLTLRGWRLNPGRRDALLYFRGNAEAVQYTRADLAAHLHDRTVYVVPYRGYGPNPGMPEEAALIADAQALHDEVRRLHPHGRIAVIGRSLGSGVAVQLAATRVIDRLILVTPLDSLSSVAQAHYPWLPVRWLLRDHYASTDHIRAHAGPWLVLRAGRDDVVPPAHTDRLIRQGHQRPRVVEFPADDHDSLSRSPRYWEAIAQFLQYADEAPR